MWLHHQDSLAHEATWLQVMHKTQWIPPQSLCDQVHKQYKPELQITQGSKHSYSYSHSTLLHVHVQYACMHLHTTMAHQESGNHRYSHGSGTGLYTVANSVHASSTKRSWNTE